MTRKLHPKRKLKKPLSTLKKMGGALRLGALMHGAKSIVLTTTKIAGAESFALPVFGVLLKMRETMPGRFAVLSITVQLTGKGKPEKRTKQ